MIDICVNLGNERFDGKHHSIIENAKNNHVTGIVLTGTSLASSKKVKQLHEAYADFTKYTAGCHPHAAKSMDDATMELIFSLADNQGCSMVGECGLDYNRMFSTKTEQNDAFNRQIALASSLGKPLFLHERDAEDDFIAACKAITTGGIVHCFTGTRQTSRKYLDLGLDIGVTGWITDDRRNADVVEALKYIPLERLHVETDSPYLSPRNMGKRVSENEPAHLHFVVKHLAVILKKHENEIREITEDNSRRLFSFGKTPKNLPR